jgi:hypothetical protein
MSATRRRLSEVQMDEDSNVRAYLSGYADGEGCFCVTFNRSDRSEVLVIYQQLLECGTIRPDRSDRTFKFEARSVSDLATKVVPHFERYPLRSSKQNDFERFAAIVQLMQRGAHLTQDGFAEIVRLSAALNVSSKKRFERTAITPEMNA